MPMKCINEFSASKITQKLGDKKMTNQTNTPDEMNPEFIFSTIKSELLAQAVRGEIDLNKLAKQELANRGLNDKAEWVGFDNAK